jgi:hypothetical protein
MIADRLAFEPTARTLPVWQGLYFRQAASTGSCSVARDPAQPDQGHEWPDRQRIRRVYDCSGSWGDPTFKGSVEQGLPAARPRIVAGAMSNP